MNKSFDPLDEYHLSTGIASGVEGKVPPSLQRAARWASLLLLVVWFFFSLAIVLSHDVDALFLAALLPGLFIAVLMVRILTSNLSKNHRPDEPAIVLPTLGAANWITMARAAGVVGLATLLPLTIGDNPALAFFLGWLGGVLYLVLCLADLLDGYAARKQQRVTELGKTLDMETDALGLLSASLLCIFLGRLPLIYILVGLAYYAFTAGLWWRHQHGKPTISLNYRPYGRIIAGCQMGLVALVFLPLFHAGPAHLAAIIFMTPFLIGFIRDWLVASCRLSTDGEQKTPLDVAWGRGGKRFIALCSRLLIAFNGVILLIEHYASESLGFWWSALAFGCLLTVLGVLGRSFALLLVLLLGLHQSPFGTDLLPMLTFGGAAVLIVVGSGPLSIWSPEDDILYRRKSSE